MTRRLRPGRRRRVREVPRSRRHADHDADSAVRFPIEFGFARIDRHRSACTGVNAQKPLVQAEIVKTDHPVVLRLRRQDLPDQVRPGRSSVLPRRRRRSGQRPGAVRRRRRRGAERPDGRRRRHPRPRVRGGRPERAQRQGPRASCSRTTRSTAGRTTASSTWSSTRSSTGTTGIGASEKVRRASRTTGSRNYGYLADAVTFSVHGRCSVSRARVPVVPMRDLQDPRADLRLGVSLRPDQQNRHRRRGRSVRPRLVRDRDRVDGRGRPAGAKR